MIEKNKRRPCMITVIAAVLCWLTACGGLLTQQKTTANEAIMALRKLEAASQLKTSQYREYSQLVIEAKARVNQAAALLPDGELKNELNATMEAYGDAATAWAAMLGNNYLRADREPGKTLGPKYSLNLNGSSIAASNLMDSLERMNNPNYENPATRADLSKIWAVAKTHLDRAAALTEQ